MPKRPNPSPKPNLWKKSRVALSTWLRGTLLAISARIDDNYPASRYTQLPHDRDLATAQKFYEDSLEAWRKNPIARRIVGIISDYVLGDGITIESKNTRLQRFIEAFWSHPENNIELRLESMCDELTRAGDLFPVLFTEEATGIPIVRFIPKDSITEIITAENDWETELEYIQPMVMGIPKTWLSPKHPDAGGTIMLHYKINPVIGALTGEGDLDAIIPWLQRYSRLLEDRVQIHWAARVFLWFVKVPASKVQEKIKQYATAPPSGSVIVHEEGEEWTMETPNLQARDAKSDLDAVRTMIRAANGFPPHWMAESGTSTLAEAKAMQAAPERHLRRRQNYFVWVLTDLTHQAFLLATRSGKWQPISTQNYKKLYITNTPDISREDNGALATAGKDLAAALQTAASQLPGPSRTFAARVLTLIHKFIGEELPAADKDKIIEEAFTNPPKPAAQPAASPNGKARTPVN